MSMNTLVLVVVIIGYFISFIAFIHCLLRTKYPQAALGWSAAILLLPYFGSFAYYLFGMNRVDSRAGRLMFHVAKERSTQLKRMFRVVNAMGSACRYDALESIVQVGAKKSLMPRQGGNHISPLYNGDKAYPEMLEAIEKSQRRVHLCTYIFAGKKYGQIFTDALIAAHNRGVDVRVIVDGIGGMNAFNPYEKILKNANVAVERFIPVQIFPPRVSLNLRNHRKLLICDNVAFTGGMNISDDNVLLEKPAHPIQDIHFKCQGPIVFTLSEAFMLDWIFLTKESKEYPEIQFDCCGDMDSRLIMDGPGSADEPMQNLICGVISAAKERVTIFTPYFLPTRELVIALSSAAARGINVRVVIPEVLNHSFVACAAEHMLPPIVTSGVKLYRQPAPFAHTKLILIDDMYTFLGSTNLDPRSLSLNFELNMEVFSHELNAELHTYAEELISHAKLVLPEEYSFDNSDYKVLFRRVKNAAAWVISPYL